MNKDKPGHLWPKPFKFFIEDIQFTLFYMALSELQKEEDGAIGFCDTETRTLKVTGSGLELNSTILHELFEALSFIKGLCYTRFYPHDNAQIFSMNHTDMNCVLAECVKIYEDVVVAWDLRSIRGKSKFKGLCKVYKKRRR